MAKKTKKILLSELCVKEALHLRNSSIRKIGKDNTFGWSSKSIERGIRDGEASPELLDALGKYLNVEPDYLSGKHHCECEKVKDDTLRMSLLNNLHADKFPYLRKQQRAKIEGKFIYEKCLEYLFISHNISPVQFDSLPFEQQKEFQLAIEDAIIPILIKYFPKDPMGQDTWPEICRIQNSIENYTPNEPDPPKNFFSDNIENRFEKDM